MSIRYQNAARTITAANTVVLGGQNQCSISYFLRVNDPNPSSDNWLNCVFFDANSKNRYTVTCLGANPTTGTLNLEFYWRTTAGGLSCNATIFANVVYPIVSVYDSSNANNQVTYIAGVPYLMTPVRSATTDTASRNFEIGKTSIGTFTRDWSLESVLALNGYAMSKADAISTLNGSADPTTIGTGVTWRGWYPLNEKASGTPIITNDVIVNAIDGSQNLTATVNGAMAGSALTYGDAMPFVSQTTYDAPTIYPSGKTVVVTAKFLMTGAPLLVTAGSATIMPTIKINGGSPITLERPFYTGDHQGIMYFLPEGEAVQSGDTVTFSVADGFFATQLGIAEGATDLPCVNKTGVPVHGDEPKTIMIGTQFTAPFSATYSFGQDLRNYGLRPLINNNVIPLSSFRDDGTIKVPINATDFMDTAQANAIDKTCYPMILGKWMLAFKPKDVGLATNIFLTSAIPGCYTELTDYRYDAATAGEYSFRVYELFLRSWTFSLAADCGPSDTSITVNDATNLKPGEGGKMWIKIDDEYMEVGSTVNTSTKVVSVVRGTLGSTAASHTSGASGTTAWYRRNPGIRFSITGPGNVPNYEGLTIYCPQDWTPPDPARPLTPADVDLSDAYAMAPSKWVRDQLANGSMINRYMAPIGTFICSAEIEDMRLETDKWWYWDSRKFINLHVTNFRPFSVASVPYVYSHINGDTYSATLLDDIDTAPAQGTIEDISVAYTDTNGNQILAGSRLLIDDEWMRVVSITGPASGATATVERGARNTTPATHSAGSITVGWRIPTVEALEERENGVVLDVTTDIVHNLRSGMWAPDKKSVDINPLARIAVTLTADLNIGNLTASVSIDSDKWQYVAAELQIVFGTETLIVASANQLAGTITFKGTTGATAFHASGTVGMGRSRGVFCKSTDDTLSTWSTSQAGPVYFYVTGPDTALMTMYCYINDKFPVLAEDQTWDVDGQTVLGVDQALISWALPHATCSIEHTCRVTELCPGSIHWLNIPILASDDLVDWIARKTRDGLTPGQHEVVVELANEVWNYFFPFAGPTQVFSLLEEYPVSAYWLIFRAKEVTDRIRAIFEEHGRGGEVFLSLPWQSSQVGDMLKWARDCSVDVDVASAAQYIYPGTTADHINAFKAADNEQCCDAWTFDLEYLTVGAQGARMRKDAASLATHRSLTSHPIRMLAYEGGLSTTLPVPSVGGHTDPSIFPHGLEKNRDVSLSPVFYHSHMDFFRICETIGDHDGVCLFNNCQQPGGTPAPSGGGAYQELWGVTTWGGQQAGYGDGSDGKFDNRVCLFQPGLPGTKDPLTSVDENTVSVRLQSFLDYNLAYSPPTPPENVDVPRRIPTRVVRRPRRNTKAIVERTHLVTVPPPPNVDVPRYVPTRVTRRKKQDTVPIIARTAIVHEAPPPPPPSPVPVVGRRVIVFRTTLS